MAEIGSTLRETRMRARIDISEVEVSTKIRAKYLRAIENEEWDLLPGPVYVKSFIKTYGDFLGLDSRLLVDEFKRRYEHPSDHEARALAGGARERERRPQRRSLAGLLLTPRTVIVTALAVIVVALVVIGSHNGKSTSGTGHGITPAAGGSGSKHHHHGTGTKKVKGAGKTTPQTGTTSTQAAPVIPKNATLTLVPIEPDWICVENQAGKPLMPAVDYDPGQKIPTLTARELLVNLGNAHVTMTVDGKPYTPTGSSIGMRITPTGVKPLTPAPDCGE